MFGKREACFRRGSEQAGLTRLAVDGGREFRSLADKCVADILWPRARYEAVKRRMVGQIGNKRLRHIVHTTFLDITDEIPLRAQPIARIVRIVMVAFQNNLLLGLDRENAIIAPSR